MEYNINTRKALKLGALQLLQENEILKSKNINAKSDEDKAIETENLNADNKEHILQ